MSFCNFKECKDKPKIHKVKKILLNKRSSQTPTVIRNKNDGQVWLFFFREKCLKSLWIYDYTVKKWFSEVLTSDVTSACLFENDIYISDSNGKIYIKKTGSNPSC